MFSKLHEQAIAKMSLPSKITAYKAEKLLKPKCGLFFETPCRNRIFHCDLNYLINLHSFLKCYLGVMKTPAMHYGQNQ